MTDIFNFRDLVGMKVKHIQFGQILQVSDSFNIVLAKHEYSEGWNCVQMRYLFDVIIVQIQEYQSRQAYEIFNFLDVVMLQVQESETFLTFKQRHVRQIALVKVQTVWIGISLWWLPVDHKDPRYLWQLCKYDFIFIFNSSNNSVLEQISISLIFFTGGQFYIRNVF